MGWLPRWTALLILPVAVLVSAASSQKDADQVRERRYAYTEAIRARNSDRMREFLTRDMVQLSSNEETTIGRDAALQSYVKHEFLDPSFVVYDRLPDTIDISENGLTAVERGHWVGAFTLQMEQSPEIAACIRRPGLNVTACG